MFGQEVMENVLLTKVLVVLVELTSGPRLTQ